MQQRVNSDKGTKHIKESQEKDEREKKNVVFGWDFITHGVIEREIITTNHGSPSTQQYIND